MVEPDTADAIVKSHRRRPSFVWFVPLIAVLIGIWLVVNNAVNRGPVVQISFTSAEGLEVGKTKVRYREVDIGEVVTISLAADRRTVVVTAQLIKSAADLLAADSRFFVVKPRVSGVTVSGLSTLLSGPYIGLDAGKATTRSREFVGLDAPPQIVTGQDGREFVLHSEQAGSVDEGSPVFFRRMHCGHVTAHRLDPDGRGVTFRIFIDAPYDRFVTPDARFYHASGVDVALSANGLRVATQSLGAIIEGGLAFEIRPRSTSTEEAPAGAAFALFADRDQALQPENGREQTYTLYFNDSLRGLSVGAPVDLHGIVIGEVKSLSVEFDPKAQVLHFPVEIGVYPDRVRSRYRRGSPTPDERGTGERELVDGFVKRGMRAQLRTGNLLTGQLLVALDFFKDTPAALIDWNADPPVFPTIGGGLGELQEKVGQIVTKVNRVPIVRIGSELSAAITSLNQTLISAEALVHRLNAEVTPEAAGTLREARATLSQAHALLGSDAAQQADLQEALQQITRAARALTELSEMLEQHPESLLYGKKKEP